MHDLQHDILPIRGGLQYRNGVSGKNFLGGTAHLMAVIFGMVLGIVACVIVALPFLNPKLSRTHLSNRNASKERVHHIDRLRREISALDTDRDLGFVDLYEYDERRFNYRLALANLLQETDQESQVKNSISGSFEEKIQHTKRSATE